MLFILGCCLILTLGYVPDPTPSNTERKIVGTKITINAKEDDEIHRLGSFVEEVTIKKGDTFITLLRRLNINDALLIKFLSTKETHKRLKLKAGNSVRVHITPQGKLNKLLMFSRNGRAMEVVPNDRGFEIRPVLLKRRLLFGSGTIQSSLYKALENNGIADELASEMADILASEIDFNRDIRSGARFSIIYSANFSDNTYISSGRIHALEFTNNGQEYRAYLFEDEDTKRSGYYTENGENIKNAFLRSPLKFSRVTSGFSKRRLHPVLKKWRAHKGIDYGAATGTPIMAVSKGTIRYIGSKGAYGRFIEIRHQNGVSTRYAHLSRYAKKLKKGTKVEQGQIIGYVGKSGMATGPHLHYEFLVNGRQVDPSKAVTPPGPPIRADRKNEFNLKTASAKNLLARLGASPTN
jgi:murein DD-endopeptidase MepM/ murein hydrolase activator NlpD